METPLLQMVWNTGDTNIANKSNRTIHTVMKSYNDFTAVRGYSSWISHVIQLDCSLGESPWALMLFALNLKSWTVGLFPSIFMI